MPCRTLKDDEGRITGFMCGRAARKLDPCRWCGKPHTKLCDYPLRGAKAGKTCDAPICDDCATSIGPDRDLCPAHAKLWKGEPDGIPKNG